MKSVAKPVVLGELKTRLGALRPEARPRWGSMTAGEMLCHLGDATALVLGRRSAPTSAPRRRFLVKRVGLYSPLRWPRGFKTRPEIDPRDRGSRPGVFEEDRRRAIEGLEAISTAVPGQLAAAHYVFGTMTPRDWQRWAYLHTDHHLRQFGR